MGGLKDQNKTTKLPFDTWLTINTLESFGELKILTFFLSFFLKTKGKVKELFSP